MSIEEKTKMDLPEPLLKQLTDFEKRLRLMETIVTVTGGLCGVLLTYGILFISDRFWDTPAWLRAILTVTGCAAFITFAVRWLRYWWWLRRDVNELARLVQRQYKGMGDRLLGAVELASGTSTLENISPALCRAAIRQVAEESEKYDFKAAAEKRKPRNYSISFLLLGVIIAASLAFFPGAGTNAFLRWLKPLSSVERYTFVRIEDIPAEQVVAHGEDFEIACQLSKFSVWRPVHAVCSFPNQPPIESSISGGKAVFRIPGQTATSILTLRIGDISKRIRIIPMYRPELNELRAQVVLPDYLQSTNQSIIIENGKTELLESSKVRFAGTANRLLAGAVMKQKTESTLELTSNRFITAELTVKELEKCAFTWTDGFGLKGVQPYELNITRVEDEAPAMECSGIARAVAILEDETIELETRAQDDYGIKELWITWRTSENKERGTKETSGRQTIKQGSPSSRLLEGKFTFSPIVLHIPEETMVTVIASATDYLPGRKPSNSLTYRIYVLSKVRHAKLIHEQFQALQSKIEDLAREEERLLDNNTETSKQDQEKLSSEKTGEALKANSQGEKDNAENLDRLSKNGEDLIKEALRNTDIPEKTLREWAELMKAMKDLAASEMQNAAKSLQQASSEKGQRSSKLAEAMKLEQDILKALRQVEKNMNMSLDDMMAKSFINRLLMVAGVESEIATTIRKLLPELVGIDPKDLPADKKEIVDQLTARHDTARKDVSNIQDDLAGFFNRTRIERYDAVHKDMKEKKTTDGLDALTGLIRRNSGAQATESAETWRKQFIAWAEMLKDKSKDGNGDGQGECTLEQADIELLISLMRARRREEGLRDQTRLVEDGREKNQSYAADARKLSDIQNDISRDTRPLERKARNQQLKRFIEKIDGEMMNASMFLRKPQTDSATIAIQTEIIELLSSSISACQSQGGGSGALGMMLMRAMGMQMGSGAGSNGGGSNAGGTTENPNTVSATGSGEERSDPRNVEKTGGTDPAVFPEEFRDILQEYFKALEKTK